MDRSGICCVICRILYPHGGGRAQPHPGAAGLADAKAEDEAASRWADFALPMGMEWSDLRPLDAPGDRETHPGFVRTAGGSCRATASRCGPNLGEAERIARGLGGGLWVQRQPRPPVFRVPTLAERRDARWRPSHGTRARSRRERKPGRDQRHHPAPLIAEAGRTQRVGTGQIHGQADAVEERTVGITDQGRGGLQESRHAVAVVRGDDQHAKAPGDASWYRS